MIINDHDCKGSLSSLTAERGAVLERGHVPEDAALAPAGPEPHHQPLEAAPSPIEEVPQKGLRPGRGQKVMSAGADQLLVLPGQELVEGRGVPVRRGQGQRTDLTLDLVFEACRGRPRMRFSGFLPRCARS